MINFLKQKTSKTNKQTQNELLAVALALLAAIFTSTVISNDELIPPRRELYDKGRIFDITHRYHLDVPEFESKNGIDQFPWLPKSMKNDSIANNSKMKLPAHNGTHVDAPGHVYDHYFDAGFDVDSLDLHVLNGSALLVVVPRHSNITAEIMKSLNIPRGVTRVLFRTLNTDRKLMFQKEFDSNYGGFTVDGAKWLVENTDIKLTRKFARKHFPSKFSNGFISPTNYKYTTLIQINRQNPLIPGRVIDIPSRVVTIPESDYETWTRPDNSLSF